MISKEQAELFPEEHLGRDLFLNSDSDLEIGSTQDFKTMRYYDDLKQAIINRLRTAIGELSLHPYYGCRLNELVGTNANSLTLSIAEMNVREALLQEPRINEITRIRPNFRALSSKQIIDIDIIVLPINSLEPLNLIYALWI